MDREAWQATVHGVTQSQTQLSTHTHTHTHWKQLGWQGLPCLETIEIRTQNLSTIIKNHKAHTDIE